MLLVRDEVEGAARPAVGKSRASPKPKNPRLEYIMLKQPVSSSQRILTDRLIERQADRLTTASLLIFHLGCMLILSNRGFSNRYRTGSSVKNRLDKTCLNMYYASMVSTTASSVSRAVRRRFDSPQQEVFLSLWRTYDRLRMLEDELFGRHELTAQQYNALRLLRAAHPEKVPTLSLGSRLVSRAPDITRLLDKLVERGWVERHRPADNRRVVLVGITPAGVRLLEQIADEVRDCHQRQLGHLEVQEMKLLIELLRKARQPHEAQGSEW